MSQAVFKRAKRNPATEILAVVNPRRRRKHHYRRNPSHRGGGSVSFNNAGHLLKKASIGAGGAIANNAFMNYVGTMLLPDSMLQGPMIYVSKFGSAILMGIALKKVGVRPETALKMTEGAMIVTMTQAMQYAALTYAGVNLSGVGYISPGRVVNARQRSMSGAGKYLTGTGKYLSGGGNDMGNSRNYQQAGSRIIPLR